MVRLPVQAVYADEALSDCLAQTETEDTAALSVSERLAGVRILVVDDEADARDLVATVLRAGGGDVTTAASAAQGLALYAKVAPLVIVCDIGMPEVDGYEFVRRLRRAGGTQVPAIALTAYSREQDRRLALEAGFQTHVSKPVEPAELVRVVAGLVQFTARQASAPIPRART